MADVRGTAVKIQLVPETTFKTPGTVGEQLSVVSCAVVPNQQRQQSQTLSGFRGQARSTAGARDGGGPIACEVAPEDIGIYLKQAIGAPTTTGSGPYTHVFAPASSGATALPVGFTIQYDYGTAIASASRYLQMNGCRVRGFTFNFTPNGPITGSLDVLASDWTKSNTDLDSTPVVLAHNNFESTELSIVLGGGSPKNICFSALTLTGSNDLDGEKFCIGAGGVRDGAPEGFFTLTGQATMFFDHEDVIDQLLSGTDTELKITCTRGTGAGTAGNESLEFEIGDLVFDVTAPPVDGPRGLRVQANFTAHRVGGSEIDFKTTLKNAVSAIT